MNLTTTRVSGIAVLTVPETRLTFPVLPDLMAAATTLIAAGDTRIVIDLAAVGYVDSAAIGCLMDLYRQTTSAGGMLKLAGVQRRVETMLTMTGAHHFLEVHADTGAALASF
jgi:anti-sigma B factor antagonist